MDTSLRWAVILLLLCAVGCDSRRGEADPEALSTPAPPPTNRIDLPPGVRANLGITFARVEPRHVARTLRVPGRFELMPDSRREHRSVLRGRIEMRIQPFDAVQPGDVLYTLDSPDWSELQNRISDTRAQLVTALARAEGIEPLLAAHEQHHRALDAAVAIWRERLSQLRESREAGVVTVDEIARTEAALASARAELAEAAEREAELRARQGEVAAELVAARERVALLLTNASTLLGVPVEELADEREGVPAWRSISIIEVRAGAPGVVEQVLLPDGSWVEQGGLVLSTIRPERLWFRARAQQSDLGHLQEGLPGTIIPPPGGSISATATMAGAVRLDLTAQADERLIDVLLVPDDLQPWARSGVAGHLEIVIAGTSSPELAVPIGATIRDGLETVLFRRDPANPNKVIRIEADLGVSDGRWVVLQSGVREGDEVVLGGIYPLMLATSGSAQKGGHFHADGTWHEGDK